MQTTETVEPAEPPIASDPLSRLIAILLKEGFTAVHEEGEDFGERIYHRSEEILFVKGETIFDILDYNQLDEITLRKAMERVAQTFKAKSGKDKAFSVLQATTVYVCIVAKNELPTFNLDRFVSSVGGAVLIPVVIIPEINHVVYPNVEDRIGTVRPRVEYLQHLLGERKESVRIHAQTIRMFYTAVGITLLIVAVSIASRFF